jgi:hypothetical protein
MSTRSNIAIQLPDGKVKVIYVHSDGYPYGVGKILNDNYNTYDKAEKLFNFGDASYLDDKIESCSFYGRDWDRDEEPARTYRNEYLYMANMRGDIHIEYIYLFKDNNWFVSSGEYVGAEKLKNSYDNSGLSYWTNFEPIRKNKEYIKYRDKHEKHAEVKMISGIGKMLTKNFGDAVAIQSFTEGMPKKN